LGHEKSGRIVTIPYCPENERWQDSKILLKLAPSGRSSKGADGIVYWVKNLGETELAAKLGGIAVRLGIRPRIAS
jgi:hypothetical protein